MKRFSDAALAEMKRVAEKKRVEFADFKRQRTDITAVGKFLFGHDWIGELTKEEQTLIDKYGPQPGKYGGTTIAPCPDGMDKILDRALGKQQRIPHQWAAACDWLHDNGLLSHERCDPTALAVAMAKQPSADKVSTVPKVGRPRRIEEIAHRIKLDIDTDRLTEQQLRAKGNGKNLAHRYNADIKTCKEAIKMVLSGAI